MARQGRSTWRTIERLALFAACGSATLLAFSFVVDNPIGSAFLFGASASLVGASILLLSFGVYVRGIESDSGVGAADGPTGSSLLARLVKGTVVTVTLERHSNHRLDGVLTVRNGTARETTVSGIGVSAPAGSKVAIGGSAAGAVPTTVSFLDVHTTTTATVPMNEKRSLRFHVLLDDRGMRARRLRLRVDLGDPGDPESTSHRNVSTPIPR